MEKKFKVKNKLECSVRFKNEIFGPSETKILKEKPISDKFDIEELEEQERIKSRR